jgi:hypothetical protein
VLSRTLELLCWKEKNVKVCGFKLAAIKRNTHNEHGNKKNQVVSLEAACFVSNLKRVEHISLGCAPTEIYFTFLKGEHLLNSQS